MPPATAPATFSLPVASLVGFLICLLLLPPYIRLLKQKAIGQFIREEGPASHAGKASTPTMGGVGFASATIFGSMAWLWYVQSGSASAIITISIAMLCGAVGLFDDLAKLQRKANAGISARLRLLLETMLGIALGLLLFLSDGISQFLLPGALITSANQVVGPFLDLGLIPYLLFCGFLVAATTNAVNLHDGMDGLAAGTAMQILSSLGFILLGTGQPALAAVAAAGAGSLAAFLLFNRYPATVFMGDSGSLFIGGLIAALAIAGRIELWFIPLTIIYIVETLSVIMQVVWFKLTKEYTPDRPLSKLSLLWLKLTKRLPGEGKRLFRMAPLHHHFEAVAADKNIAEWQVVAYFWVAQLFVCIAVLVAFKSFYPH